MLAVELKRSLTTLLLLSEKLVMFITVALAINATIQKKNNSSDVPSLTFFSTNSNITLIMTKTSIKRLFLITIFFIFLVFFNNALFTKIF